MLTHLCHSDATLVYQLLDSRDVNALQVIFQRVHIISLHEQLHGLNNQEDSLLNK
jgi:hypothetical protein